MLKPLVLGVKQGTDTEGGQICLLFVNKMWAGVNLMMAVWTIRSISVRLLCVYSFLKN